MTKIIPLATDIARAYQSGAPDANGQPPERHISDGSGNPCRHCLTNIAKGAAMLILAHRPFATLHPYAELGPIFLCADPCDPWSGPGLPPVLTSSPDYLIKGYTAADRIYYGTGKIVPSADLPAAADAIFANPDVAYIHIRSARNNCYQARIERD